MSEHQSEASRMSAAIKLGERCDRTFAAECRRLQIGPLVAITAPLAFIGIASAKVQGRA